MRCKKSSGTPTSLAGLLLAAGFLLLASSYLLAERPASSKPADATPGVISGVGPVVPMVAPDIAGGPEGRNRGDELASAAGGARVVGVVDMTELEIVAAEEEGGSLKQTLRANQIPLGGHGSASDFSSEEQVDRPSINSLGDHVRERMTAGEGEGEGGAHLAVKVSEAASIQPIDIPFLQQPDEWQVAGHGISLKATGEPKSGTTWLGRLVPELALELCGSPVNSWCQMGGLVVIPNIPGPKYDFEMIDTRGPSPTLFLHFKGGDKHVIPGMDTKIEFENCHNGGRVHENFFGDEPPCISDESPTRSRLQACLWNTSMPCRPSLSPMDPAVRRTVVILRDPRNVILSEHKMRLKYYKVPAWIHEVPMSEYVYRRFEALVSWTHQRWEWHRSDAMSDSSHIVIYDDLQESHLGMVGIAAFMGLHCTPEQAFHVWRTHQNELPHPDYTGQGLEVEVVKWMNATMARLLPEPLAHRWGIVPTDL